MDTENILNYYINLSLSEQEQFFRELQLASKTHDYGKIMLIRGNALDDKRAECPHCLNSNYTKFGKDKGSRRYKCKNCNRTFTEYTGTWLSGIHHKDKIPEFLNAVEAHLSLKKTSKRVKINEETAFRWRHRFLSAIEQPKEDFFKGITESDETFFLHSQKGVKCVHRISRQRGGGHKAGISNEDATVFTALDRGGNIALEFTNMGRISEADIVQAIGKRVNKRTVLCSDGHNSYKAFTRNKKLEHHILNASKNERVKGSFHIQRVNSLHSKLKGFLNNQLRGVATKYLQKYLNWQIIKGKFQSEVSWIGAVFKFSMQQPQAMRIYNRIQKDYNKIYITTLNPS